MKSTNPYLIFNGECREASTFYAKCLGTEAHMQTYGEIPGCGPEMKSDLIMHAHIQNGDVTIMASDTTPDKPVVVGTNTHININCESREELDKLFTGLGAGGTTIMAPGDTFWGAYFGMLKDRFGVQWMFNYELPKA